MLGYRRVVVFSLVLASAAIGIAAERASERSQSEGSGDAAYVA